MANTNFVYVVAIKPKDNYPLSVMDKIESAVRYTLVSDVKNRLTNALEKRTSQWKSQPKFIGVYRRPNQNTLVLQIDVSGSDTAKNRWKWVSLGTKRSGMIRPRRARALRYRRYVARTQPGNIYGIGGTRHVGPTYYSQGVPASSIKAREFETFVVKENADDVYRSVKRAIDNALRSS